MDLPQPDLLMQPLSSIWQEQITVQLFNQENRNLLQEGTGKPYGFNFKELKMQVGLSGDGTNTMGNDRAWERGE